MTESVRGLKSNKLRDGRPANSNGRLIVAGVAPFARQISSRSSESDLWAAVEASVRSTAGFKRIMDLHGIPPHKQSKRQINERMKLFIHQARQYYSSIRLLSPLSKPLVSYYFILNLTKAFLTVADPKIIDERMRHGLSDKSGNGKRYSFNREMLVVKDCGAFHYLAKNTGMRHCWQNNYELAIHDLVPYLPDGYTTYADSTGKAPRLLPIRSAEVMVGEISGFARCWIRIEVDKNGLAERGINPGDLKTKAAIFYKSFNDAGTCGETVFFESREMYRFDEEKQNNFRSLCRLYDETLIGCDRSFSKNKLYVVLSKGSERLSHEAVTFAVMHHLSNIVRYRPYDGHKILNGKHGWLLRSWVDSASETFLLNMASRISGLDHVMV